MYKPTFQALIFPILTKKKQASIYYFGINTKLRFTSKMKTLFYSNNSLK